MDLDGSTLKIVESLLLESRDGLQSIVVIRYAAVLRILRPRIRILIPHDEDVPRIGDRQRPQEYGVDDSKNRGVCPDANRQCQNGGCSKATVFPQKFDGKFNVTKEIFHKVIQT